MADMKYHLRKLEFPQFAKEALTKLEQLCNYASSPQQQRLIQDVIEEFVFCEIDRQGFRTKRLNAIQELHLLDVLCTYFENQNNEVLKNTMFLNMFHYEVGGSNKMKILSKLVSLSIAIRNTAVLNCISVWMQQQGCTSEVVVSLIKDLVTDYFVLVPHSAAFLYDLPNICVQFAARFITGTTALYNCANTNREMPEKLLKLITQWVSSNQQLCLAPLTINVQNSLPRGSIGMPPITPFPGLIRWCVQAPLQDYVSQLSTFENGVGVTSERNKLYSQLHIGILESMMEAQKIRQSITQKEIVTTRDFVSLVDGLHSLLNRRADLIGTGNLSVALERLGQALQVAIATSCFHGNVADLCWHISTKLPQHRLLGIIVKKYHTM